MGSWCIDQTFHKKYCNLLLHKNLEKKGSDKIYTQILWETDQRTSKNYIMRQIIWQTQYQFVEAFGSMQDFESNFVIFEPGWQT